MATSCDTCGADVGFNIVQPRPGTPVGRYVTPMVRINAKVDEMKPGMKIAAHYIDLVGLQAALAALPPVTP